MTAQCPICRSPLEVDDAKIPPDGLKATCPLCDEVFVVRSPQASAAPSPAPAPGSTRSGTPSHGATGSGSLAHASRRLLEEDSGDGAAPRVLVAHDSFAFGETVKTLLEEEGFDVEVDHDGDAAMAVLTERTPAVAILEAALPRRFGFQICADVRGRPEPLPVKLLLVASVYDRRRLGRTPSVAVAPDDFLEPRNIELELLPKVKRLLRGRSDATGSRAAAPASRDGSSPEARARNADLSRSEIAPRPPEVLPPAPSKRRDPTHPTHPTMGEADFADLFEDAGSATGSRSREADAPPPPIDDVDAFLAAPSSAPSPAPSPSSTAASSEDAEGVLSSSPELPLDEPEPPSVSARARPSRAPLRIGDEPVLDSDEREIWARVLADDEEDSKKDSDDELLRTLMEMANDRDEDSSARGSASDEGAAISAKMPDDEGLGGMELGFDDEKPSTRASGAEPAKTDPLDEILDQVSGPKTSMEGPTARGGDASASAPAPKKRDDDILRVDDFLSDEIPVPSEDYSADETPAVDARDRAPSAGPLEMPSVGPVPDSWKPGKDEKAAAGSASDDDLLGALEGDDGVFETSSPRSESSRPTAPLDDDDSPGKRRVSLDSPTEQSAGGGVMPSYPRETPTVLKKGGTPARAPAGDKDPSTEDFSSSLPPVTMEDSDNVPPPSFNSTELVAKAGGDDDIDGLLERSFSDPATDPDTEEEPQRTRAGGHADVPASGAKKNGNGATGADAEHEKAKRLAKLIVGDILLYNAEKIPDAVRTGTFFDVMKGDIKDGREFFEEKIPEAIRAERDYIQELLDETLANKKKELGLS